MAQIAIGAAVGEGFSLISKQPVTILAWGIVQVALSTVVFAAMAPSYLAVYGPVFAQAAGGVAAQPNVAAVQSMVGPYMLTSLLDLAIYSILYCAIYRSVLHPERAAWAYLRVGIVELFFFLFLIGALIAMFIGMLVIFIPIFIVVAITAVVHAAVIGALLILASYLGVFILAIWTFCRLSMVGPMMVEDGNFHLFDAWALTKGHFWPLFAIAALLVLIVMVLEVLIGVVTLAFGIGWLSQAIGGASNFRSFFLRPPAEIMSILAPALLVAAVFSIPLFGCLSAILLAPWARAYRDLRPLTDVAATFA